LTVVSVQPQTCTLLPFNAKPSSHLQLTGMENMFWIISEI